MGGPKKSKAGSRMEALAEALNALNPLRSKWSSAFLAQDQKTRDWSVGSSTPSSRRTRRR
jgi:hypothetical protein